MKGRGFNKHRSPLCSGFQKRILQRQLCTGLVSGERASPLPIRPFSRLISVVIQQRRLFSIGLPLFHGTGRCCKLIARVFKLWRVQGIDFMKSIHCGKSIPLWHWFLAAGEGEGVIEKEASILSSSRKWWGTIKGRIYSGWKVDTSSKNNNLWAWPTRFLIWFLLNSKNRLLPHNQRPNI